MSIINSALNVLLGSHPAPVDLDAKCRSDDQNVHLPMGMRVITVPDMKPDEFIIGYPDGKGGLKPGAVKGKL